MKFVSTKKLALQALALMMCVGSNRLGAQGPHEIIKHRPNRFDAAAPTSGATGVQSPAIAYYGGALISTPNVYLIWYGNWNQSNGSDTPAGQQIVRDFLHGINNSPYYQINKSYGTPTGYINIGREATDTGSQGTTLTDAKVQSIVSTAISTGKLPADVYGIYFVLTSSNVAESSGFCTNYCGWHTAGWISGLDIKYAFVGNSNRCLSACAAQMVGPNGNAGIDAMVSVIAHELEETNTDPEPISGWADANGSENADKCAWTFGQSLSIASNGAYYNMTLPTVSGGSRHYLIQRNLAANSECYVDYIKKTQ